jgi:ectoine hydroxylase-related dioxygenase (phytanoyl-CoA dioxygenase family)
MSASLESEALLRRPTAGRPSLNELADTLEREGFLILRDVLTVQEVDELCNEVEHAFSLQSADAEAFGMPNSWRPRMFEHGPVFEALIDHPGMIDLIETVLGEDCHLIAMNAMRFGKGDEIAKWHADDVIRVPLPPGVELDPRIKWPCFVISINYYLTDVDEYAGPTEFVPGSHRAGRQPLADDLDANGNPVFAGRSVIKATGRRGTAVLWNDQVWHRGGLNTTAHKRLVQQVSYGRRFMAQRFYPFAAYALPAETIGRAKPRRRRLLGLHGHGAYG